MFKVCWSNIPEGYNYVAVDPDNCTYAFADKPVFGGVHDEWLSPGECLFLGNIGYIILDGEYEDSLQVRPGHDEG